MTPFLSHILLTLAWGALTGEFSAANMAFGFLIGGLVLWRVRRRKKSQYLNRLRHLAGFLVFFVAELVSANLRVAHDLLTPRNRMRPGILAIPLELESEVQILALASLITLTPGTLCLDISEDRRTIYVHAMYLHDPEGVRRTIKEGFERRIREVFQ